ncbi:MAG: VanZ family protein [Rhizomicrobium sp.]
MTRSRFDRNFLLVTIGIVAVIVHGSLYPYAFRILPASIGAIATLIGSWARPPTSFGDFVANVLLYMPLGFFGVLALRSSRRLLFVSLFGLVLCTGIELAQFYDAGRVTNMSDVYLNTCGTWLGGFAGTLVDARSRRLLPRVLSSHPVPCLLLAAMLGYRLFPYVPLIDLHKYWRAVKPVLLHPNVAPWPIGRYFVLWLTASYLVATIAGRRLATVSILLLVACVFAARIAIVNLALTMPEIIGAGLAVGVWSLILARSRRSAVAVAALLCVTIVALRLMPFDFETSARPFGWLPFRSFLGGSLDTDIVSFLEKCFLYGSLIWIGHEAGLRIWTVTGATAGLLFATSLAETHLPGRSAEITDAVMVLLIGGIFATMIAARNEERGPRARTGATIAFQSGQRARTNPPEPPVAPCGTGENARHE